MSELATLARPYAAAVFKQSKAKAATTTWSASLAFLSAVIGDSKMAAIAQNPKIKKDQLTEIFLDIAKGHIDDEGRNFLKLLVQNNRLALLPEIARLYEELRAEDEGYIEVNVHSAFPFSQDGEKQFAAKLEKKLSKKVHMNVTIAPSLIGGVLVRAGDQVIDGSIKGQLENLRKALQ